VHVGTSKKKNMGSRFGVFGYFKNRMDKGLRVTHLAPVQLGILRKTCRLQKLARILPFIGLDIYSFLGHRAISKKGESTGRYQRKVIGATAQRGFRRLGSFRND
jgi:hypothetical protein